MKLYLQLNNTCKQNKSRYLLGFAGYLVLRKILKSVKISFLPVGHTHEKIDQMFSRLAVYLRSHNLLSMDDLLSALEKCYQPTPKAKYLKSLANISGFLHEYLPSSGFRNISRYRQFKISRNLEMKPVVRGRVRPHKNIPWEGLGEYESGNGSTAIFNKEKPPPLWGEDVEV